MIQLKNRPPHKVIAHASIHNLSKKPRAQQTNQFRSLVESSMHSRRESMARISSMSECQTDSRDLPACENSTAAKNSMRDALRNFSLQADGDAEHSLADKLANELHQISQVQAHKRKIELRDARLKGLDKQRIQRGLREKRLKEEFAMRQFRLAKMQNRDRGGEQVKSRVFQNG
jgi:hypothetical protein